jgi:hypothetical protein
MGRRHPRRDAGIAAIPITSDSLVFGECAGHIDITQADADKMRSLADRFDGKPYLAFSTLKDEFSNVEKEWLLKLAADDYKVGGVKTLKGSSQGASLATS